MSVKENLNVGHIQHYNNLTIIKKHNTNTNTNTNVINTTMHNSTTVRTLMNIVQHFKPLTTTGHYFPHQIIKSYIFSGRTRPEPVRGLQQQYCKYSKGADFVNKWLILCFN